MDWEAWHAAVHWVTELDMTEQLNWLNTVIGNLVSMNMPIWQRSPKACWNLVIHLCILHWHTFNISLLSIHVSILVPFLLPSLSLFFFFFCPGCFFSSRFLWTATDILGWPKCLFGFSIISYGKTRTNFLANPIQSLKLFLFFQELDQKDGKLFLVFQVSNCPICSIAGQLTMWQGCPLDQNPQDSLMQWPRPILPARSKDYLRSGNNLVPEINSVQGRSRIGEH